MTVGILRIYACSIYEASDVGLRRRLHIDFYTVRRRRAEGKGDRKDLHCCTYRWGVLGLHASCNRLFTFLMAESLTVLKHRETVCCALWWGVFSPCTHPRIASNEWGAGWPCTHLKTNTFAWKVVSLFPYPHRILQHYVSFRMNRSIPMARAMRPGQAP